MAFGEEVEGSEGKECKCTFGVSATTVSRIEKRIIIEREVWWVNTKQT